MDSRVIKLSQEVLVLKWESKRTSQVFGLDFECKMAPFTEIGRQKGIVFIYNQNIYCLYYKVWISLIIT
jgi:hypothetical protein